MGFWQPRFTRYRIRRLTTTRQMLVRLATLTAIVFGLTACAAPWEESPPGETALPEATATVVAIGPELTFIATPAEWHPVGIASPVGGAPGPVEIVMAVSPAVVTIVNEQRVGDLGSELALETGRGTGFIIDEEGHIITNWHVVEGGDQFKVIFADGEKRPVTLVGTDRMSDLAVVQVDGDVPAVVQFGDSDALAPGLPVLAIGSPLGAFTNTVTDGIVSALGRDLPGAPIPGEPAYSNLIQHSAPINPGNSGGPLFDYGGRVIGVNTLGIPQVPGLGIPAQGLFFAIPSNTVQRMARQLIEKGRVTYPYLGLEAQEITPELASLFDLPIEHGAFVVALDLTGPAAQAGIREGDFILALGNDQIDEQTPYTEALFAHEPGETLEATVLRGTQEIRIPVTLAELPPQLGE
jgi:2-alkenal reductase